MEETSTLRPGAADEDLSGIEGRLPTVASLESPQFDGLGVESLIGRSRFIGGGTMVTGLRQETGHDSREQFLKLSLGLWSVLGLDYLLELIEDTCDYLGLIGDLVVLEFEVLSELPQNRESEVLEAGSEFSVYLV